MSKENKNLNEAENSAFNMAAASSSTFNIAAAGTSTFVGILPLEMRWQPKEDITIYELAKCLPYLLRHDRYNNIMPYEIDKSENHFRHFDIIDHNVK